VDLVEEEDRLAPAAPPLELLRPRPPLAVESGGPDAPLVIQSAANPISRGN